MLPHTAGRAGHNTPPPESIGIYEIPDTCHTGRVHLLCPTQPDLLLHGEEQTQRRMRQVGMFGQPQHDGRPRAAVGPQRGLPRCAQKAIPLDRFDGVALGDVRRTSRRAHHIQMGLYGGQRPLYAARGGRQIADQIAAYIGPWTKPLAAQPVDDPPAQRSLLA